ncbi:MAG: hypothetical protein RLZZ522_910, partial [Verrucomicrobiota bacterium]
MVAGRMAGVQPEQQAEDQGVVAAVLAQRDRLILRFLRDQPGTRFAGADSFAFCPFRCGITVLTRLQPMPSKPAATLTFHTPLWVLQEDGI